MGEQSGLDLLRNEAQIHHAVQLPMAAGLLARTCENQLEPRGRVRRPVALERAQREVGVFGAVASTEVEEVVTRVDAWWQRSPRRCASRYLSAAANDTSFAPDRRPEKPGREHCFSLGNEEDACRLVEYGLDGRKIRVRFVMEQRLQEGAVAGALHSEERWPVQVRREHDRSIGLFLAFDVIEKLRRMDVLIHECPRRCFRYGADADRLGTLVEGD